MADRFPLWTLASGLVAGTLLFSSITPAQSAGMYQVEVLVFAYPAGGTSEQWEAIPELAYPASTRVLSDSRNQSGIAPQARDSAPPAVAPDGSGAAVSSVTPATTLSSAYVTLPATQREFGAKAAYMQRSGRYRILFHEAWTQPMGAKSAAVPIVLDRSGVGGDWPELQGTITLYDSGYFFLETNLWLNTQGEYLPGAWRMPPPPRGPGSGGVPVEAGPVPFDGNLPHSAPSGSPDGAVAELARPGPDYPYRHAVLLKQTRRMRSGEVHYIDHPMLGVLVKVTPLDETAAGNTEGDFETLQQTNPPP